MATSTVQVRELMGPNQFAKRREMFDKYDSVFTPQNSVNTRHSESSYGRPVLVSNQENPGTFQRNTSYSSFREPRSSANNYHHQRKWSDTQNSERLDEGVVVREKYYGDLPRSYSSSDYSQSVRRQRLSKLRAEFLASNLHSPEDLNKPLQRFGARASLPARKTEQYRVTSHIYKFPFAEPYGTPPAVRKIHLDFGTPIKKNSISTSPNEELTECPNDIQPETDSKSEDISEVFTTDASPVSSDHSTISNSATTPDKNNFRERFEKLRNEYAPHVSPTNLLEKLPPTRPRIISTTPKDQSRSNSQEDYTDSLPKLSDDETVQTPEVGTSELPYEAENDAVSTAIAAIDNESLENNKPAPVNNVTTHTHQRSPSDIPKDSEKTVQPQRRNTEDNTNKTIPFTKTKKRNIFQRLFLLKNKRDK